MRCLWIMFVTAVCFLFLLTLAVGQKIAWVYRQNFTGRATLQPRQLDVWLHSKGLETVAIRKLTLRVDGLILPGILTRVKVHPPARVTLACSWGNLPTRVTLVAL